MHTSSCPSVSQRTENFEDFVTPRPSCPGFPRTAAGGSDPPDVVADQHRIHDKPKAPALSSLPSTREVFRLWQRPQVKAGDRYRVGDGQIEIDLIELILFAFIDEADIRRTGEAGLESLRRRAAHAGPIHDETLLYRIEFHVVG